MPGVGTSSVVGGGLGSAGSLTDRDLSSSPGSSGSGQSSGMMTPTLKIPPRNFQTPSNLPVAPGTPGTPGTLPHPAPVPQTPRDGPPPGSHAFETDLPQELLHQVGFQYEAFFLCKPASILDGVPILVPPGASRHLGEENWLR